MFSLDRFDLESWFRDSDFGQRVLAERHDKHLAERKALLAQLEQLDQEAAITIPAANKNADKARRAADKAEAVFRDKCAAAAEAHARAFALSQSHSAQRQRIELQLRKSADPAIEEFQSEMRALAETQRHQEVATEETRKDYRGMPYFEISASTRASVVRRLEAIGAAIEKAEQLKLDACDDIPVALQRIRDELPEIIMEPVAGGTRDWPTMGVPGTHPGRLPV